MGFFTGLLLVSILSYSVILIPREISFLKTISVLAQYNAIGFYSVPQFIYWPLFL